MRRGLLLVVLAVFSFSFLQAQNEAGIFCTEMGAIGGYDPVAYFSESKPVPGKRELFCNWSDAEWHFSTPENLEAFKSSPEKYAPQFGGFCAYSTASGHKYPSIPDSWVILDNKLYFYFNLPVQKLWNKNPKGLIEQANRNWPLVKLQKVENP